jgi:hypothetical protein
MLSTLVVLVALAFRPLAYVRLAGVVVQGTVVDRHETFETPTEDMWRRVYEATYRLEFRLSEVRNIQTDHDRRRRAKPTPRRRATDSEVCGDGHVPGALDEIPKAGGRSAADVMVTIIGCSLTPLNSRTIGSIRRA